MRRGGHGAAVGCDVTGQAGIQAAVATVATVDVLIISAGILDDKPLGQVTADGLRRMYEVNMIGLFITTQAALARMPGGGRIISISSRACLGSRHHARYVPSKAAVIGLTRTLAIGLGPRQIMVNAIAPGMVRTPKLAGMTAPSSDTQAFRIRYRSSSRAELVLHQGQVRDDQAGNSHDEDPDVHAAQGAPEMPRPAPVTWRPGVWPGGIADRVRLRGCRPPRSIEGLAELRASDPGRVQRLAEVT
jgi:NAD(P)-dependent dehydrogenase (short-subunit alcohol dehydrogenase family)